MSAACLSVCLYEGRAAGWVRCWVSAAITHLSIRKIRNMSKVQKISHGYFSMLRLQVANKVSLDLLQHRAVDLCLYSTRKWTFKKFYFLVVQFFRKSRNSTLAILAPGILVGAVEGHHGARAEPAGARAAALSRSYMPYCLFQHLYQRQPELFYELMTGDGSRPVRASRSRRGTSRGTCRAGGGLRRSSGSLAHAILHISAPAPVAAGAIFSIDHGRRL